MGVAALSYEGFRISVPIETYTSMPRRIEPPSVSLESLNYEELSEVGAEDGCDKENMAYATNGSLEVGRLEETALNQVTNEPKFALKQFYLNSRSSDANHPKASSLTTMVAKSNQKAR